MKKITNYKISVGFKFDYVEAESRMPVIITDISFDGFVFLITFRHEGDNTFGTTQYPERLKQRRK